MRLIQYPRGVPRWFTYAVHLLARRRCDRVGHASFPLCKHCGQIQGPLPPEARAQ